MSRDIKFRIWDGQEMRAVDLYWFEEEGIREVDDIPEGTVVMQYTGLHDRVGKEVYEGDIVKTTLDTGELTSVTETVVYQEKYAAFDPFCRLISYEDGIWMDCLFDGFEVVGNIYENPGLVRKA